MSKAPIAWVRYFFTVFFAPPSPRDAFHAPPERVELQHAGDRRSRPRKSLRRSHVRSRNNDGDRRPPPRDDRSANDRAHGARERRGA